MRIDNFDLLYEFYKRFIYPNRLMKCGGSRYQYVRKLNDLASMPTLYKFIDFMIGVDVLQPINDDVDTDFYRLYPRNFKIAVELNSTYMKAREMVEWNSTLIIE